MYALYRGWSNEYVDYALLSDHVRIDVDAWAVLRRVEDQYFVPQNKLRVFANYVRKIGLRGAFVKAVSRLKEEARNEKYVSAGFGTVLERLGSGPAVGSRVAFLAYNHPKCVDRLVVHHQFVIPWEYERTTQSVIFFAQLPPVEMEMPEFVIGWSPFAGKAIDGPALGAYLRAAARRLEASLDSPSPARELRVARPRPVAERIERSPDSRHPSDRPRAVLFGMGQYAKVHILRNVRDDVDLRKIHEVDPMQIGRVRLHSTSLDAGPMLRDDEDFDVCFVAGFHHHHAPLALSALQKGRYAVVEKPLATTHHQIQSLEHILKDNPKLFLCFHNRYTKFNALIKNDLEIGEDNPVNYHALVHEAVLPRNHWYRWPNSAGRIIYNGCNWIDHFFFLNGYAPVRKQWVHSFQSDDILVGIELENDAACSLVLSGFGSRRRGLREHVEVTTRSGIARIIDGSRLISENKTRVIRRARENHLMLYRNMYRSIIERIKRSETGDPINTLRSSRCVLELSAELDAKHSLSRVA